jgi:hypothetical protein
MNDSRGAIWRKWDLHVHTPDSLTHPYRGRGRDPWEAFFVGLESLPAQFKVIGINDYIFVDGYRKVLAAKHSGRLKNIDLFLPVIELRLNQFGGVGGNLSKVNYHVIFSDEVSADTIESQFIAALANRFELSPEYAGLRKAWSALPTRDSLTDLGNKIIESVPAEKRGQFKAPLVEGFNNLTFSLDTIQNALRNHYFEGRYLTAIGKTEWADIRWNDQSIASNKHLINDVDIVFVAAESPEAWRRAQESLAAANVNAQLFDCSDSHHFADVVDKDRLGNCYTWIKADTTFAGLRQAIIEYADRVFVGDLPGKLKHIERHSTKFLKAIEVRKSSGSSLDEEWFDFKLELNPDLVALVGNKGSGKSALLDILALLGSTRQSDYFSFLNKDRFRQPRTNKAGHFTATVEWESGDTRSRKLDESVASSEVEAVKYIPQSFLETICNETSDRGALAFDSELKAVIFSHVAEADRLGHQSLDALLDYKTSQISGAIDLLQSDLKGVNEDIVDLEGQATEEYRDRIENLLAVKRAELAAHENARPATVSPPEEDEDERARAAHASEQLTAARLRLAEAIQETEALTERQRVAARRVAAAARVLGKLQNFGRQVESFAADLASDFEIIGVQVADVVRIEMHTATVDARLEALRASA